MTSCWGVQAPPHSLHPSSREPIVLMSAVRKIFLGADCFYAAFIPKPFDLDHDFATVAALIGPAAH